MEGSALIIISLFVGGAVIALLIYIGIRVLQADAAEDEKKRRDRSARLLNAESSYKKSLEQLKIDPTNADVKQQTLALGRAYAQLTRYFSQQGGRVTIFDEMALLNDINAACASISPPSKGSQVAQSIETRLSSLAELKSKNLIDDVEYAERRQKILNEI